MDADQAEQERLRNRRLLRTASVVVVGATSVVLFRDGAKMAAMLILVPLALGLGVAAFLSSAAVYAREPSR